MKFNIYSYEIKQIWTKYNYILFWPGVQGFQKLSTSSSIWLRKVTLVIEFKLLGNIV